MVLSLYKKPIAIGATVLVVVVVLYFLLRKKAGDFNSIPLPTGGNLSEVEQKFVRELSMRLHADMDGIQWTNFTRDVEAWRTLVSLNDTMFVAVFNDFGRLYYREGNGTLRTWIEDESAWTDSAGIASKSDVIERMNNLNLQ